MIRVVLVDDQTLVRRGIRSLLELAGDIAIVAEAGDVLVYTDVLAVSNSITFANGFYGTLPFTAATIETSTTVTSVTASWHPEP